MNPYEKLCNKDPRNPQFNDIYGDGDEKPVPREGCSCDNCFYGRDVLALELIRYHEALKALVPYMEMAFNAEGDTFGVHHNDATDALSVAEELVATQP